MSNINWSTMTTAEDKAAQVKASQLASVAARRYAAETAGITVSGMKIDTGRDSQGLITGAAVSALIDPAYVCRWKTSEGFVDIDAETLKSLAQTLRAYVQACFDREEALQQLVEKGTFQDYLLEKGWPEVEIS